MARIFLSGASGNVGKALVREIAAGGEFELAGGWCLEAGEDLGTLAGIAPLGVKASASLEEGVAASKPDIVVEFAGREAVKEYAVRVLEHGSDLVIASIGALADPAFREKLQNAAKEHHHKVYLPNGAIGALDLMQTFALMGEAEVMIGNTKAPKSLEGAPYLRGQSLPTDKKEIIFEGSVTDAINGFPKNVNVAVAAALASDTLKRATVQITSDPESKENIHKITLKNALMKAEVTIAGKPDPANPKSSTSTAWSVVALLKNLASPIQFF